MTVPTITALPEIPAYSDANFETKAPAVLSAMRNTFIAEMNAAIAAINSYDYGAAVNANIITGQVAVANGGTGLSTLAAGRIPYGAGTSAFGNSASLTFDGTTFLVAANILCGGTPTSGDGVDRTVKGQRGANGNTSGGDLTVLAGGGSGTGANGDLILGAGETVSSGSITSGGSVYIRSGKSSDATASGDLVFQGYVTGNNLVEVMRIKSSNSSVGIGTTAPSTKLHVNGPARVGSYTVATVPSASTAGAGSMIYVTDDVGGAVIAFSDGTNWLRVTDRAIVSTT